MSSKEKIIDELNVDFTKKSLNVTIKVTKLDKLKPSSIDLND